MREKAHSKGLSFICDKIIRHFVRHNKEVVKLKYDLMDLGGYNFSTLAKFKALLLLINIGYSNFLKDVDLYMGKMG